MAANPSDTASRQGAGSGAAPAGAPPLAMGRKPITTTSSILVSSSEYLNDPRIREHLAQQCLRKIGDDYPSYVGAYEWYEILKPHRHEAEVDEMFRDAARQNAALAAWWRSMSATGNWILDWPRIRESRRWRG